LGFIRTTDFNHRHKQQLAGSGSKELLELIGEMILSTGEERFLAHANLSWPNTGTYAATGS
jgi:hypothetical protein